MSKRATRLSVFLVVGTLAAALTPSAFAAPQSRSHTANPAPVKAAVQYPDETPPSLSHLDPYRLDEVTLSGSHNTYQKKGSGDDEIDNDVTDSFAYVFDAFKHVQAIEIDVYNVDNHWYVNHLPPVPGRPNDNNCPEGGDPGNHRNQDLYSCLEGLRKWSDRNPNHPLEIVKLEMKIGLRNSASALDAVITEASRRLPRSMLFTPEDLMCQNPPSCTERYATPDAAARADNWPTMASLRGKFMFVMVHGTIPDPIANDAAVRYAKALRDGSANVIFPSLLIDKTKAGHDPRPSEVADWFVIFDMQSGYLPDGPQHSIAQDTMDWMRANHYLIFVSNGARNNPPANIPCSDTAFPGPCRQEFVNVMCPPSPVQDYCIQRWSSPDNDLTVDLTAGREKLANLIHTYGINVLDDDQERVGLVDPQPISLPAGAPTARWDSLDGATIASGSQPAVTTWGAGRVELVIKDAAGDLEHRSFGPSGWTPWESLNNNELEDPTIVAIDSGNLDVFAHDSSGVYMLERINDVWGTWKRVGDPVLTGLAAVTYGGDRVDLFAVHDSDSFALEHSVLDRETGTLGPWESLGTELTRNIPGVTSRGPGLIDVVESFFGPVRARSFANNTWGPWTDVDATAPPLFGPALASWAPDRMDAFVPIPDGAVKRYSWDGTSWSSALTDLGGQATSSASAVAQATGEVDVYVRGEDGSVQHMWFAEPA